MWRSKAGGFGGASPHNLAKQAAWQASTAEEVGLEEQSHKDWQSGKSAH